MFNALSPNLMRAFHIGPSCLGHLSENYFYANVIFLFPAGMLLNRVSTRKVIILAMAAAASVVCMFSFAASTSIWQADSCRFVTGIVGSFCLLSNVRLASRWFEPRQMALVIRLIVNPGHDRRNGCTNPIYLSDGCPGVANDLTHRRFFRSHNALVDCLISERFPSRGQASLFREHQMYLHDLGLWRVLWRTVKNSQNLVIRWDLYSSLMNFPIFFSGRYVGKPLFSSNSRVNAS
ncbi:MFS transporter [Candidatus Coxiella mudrowiae]|uniref:MFS transporter n=1 Tax=Candidatus Coxiella mudrowiae TaxID=2054173 RepID=UPI000AD54278|nr:MFS transporter [Candidatus Coxiella mudrowiae]